MSLTSASGALGARTVQFRASGPHIPFDLVRARDAGEVVFVVGAGASRGCGLPSFEGLTSAVFRELTGADPAQIGMVPHAEHAAFKGAAYDVALGLLEDRLDGTPSLSLRLPSCRVREAVAHALTADGASSLDRHRDLLVLSRDLSGRPRIVTTNFDTLFERAWPLACGTETPIRSRAGGDLPGPGMSDFAGVLHLHGRLADSTTEPLMAATDLVLTSADFGDAYLRSGWAARFLYDLVRRYHLVLVGYGAEDPPLKYLLNVISADRRRFSDLKPIYAFDSAGENGDETTQAWLAKGIKPLLYEADTRHSQLYNTLAEWAASVDDPQNWAERRLRAVAGRSYSEVDGEERGVIELLLASPTNCTRFKGFGADFSWVRAIEEGRPGGTGSLGDRSRLLSDGAAYPESLRAWLNSRLEEPAALAWAVDRIAPPRGRPRDEPVGELNLREQREVAGSTAIRGFSPDELSVLGDLIEQQSKGWAAEIRRFWSLISQAVQGDGRGFYERYAYGIIERLKTDGPPDLDDIERLARFLRPKLKIERPWRWSTEEAEEGPSIPLNPEELASRSLHWDGHPDHGEVCAALPDDARWLVLLLRALEAELNRVYRLAVLMGWLGEGRDLLQNLTHRVATEPHWTRS